MKSNKVEFVKGLHYGEYVQSNENITVTCLGKETYQFQIQDWDEDTEEIIKSYQPVIITPNSDLNAVEQDILFELDTQMYYEGEKCTKEGLTAKRSKTREHIQNAQR
jgi:hypothetical protein